MKFFFACKKSNPPLLSIFFHCFYYSLHKTMLMLMPIYADFNYLQVTSITFIFVISNAALNNF